MKIKRTRNGLLQQNCDVYIANKMDNDHWKLPRSEWANPFYSKEDALQKYEQHVRRSSKLWYKLNQLEGKLLGCWCKDPAECHGSVLIKLLAEKKMKDLNTKFDNAGLTVDPFNLECIAGAYEWAKEPRLLAYATRLDRSNIFYFQPPVLEAILRIWNIPTPPYWPATTIDDLQYWVIGMYKGPQPLGPFWDDRADLEKVNHPSYTPFYPAMPNLVDLFKFAEILQRFIDHSPEPIKESLVSTLYQHALHRCIVKRVGLVNRLDMADHDLSKSRIVQVALAYWHRWDAPHDQALVEAAIRAVKAGHCNVEDHHPEFELVQNGPLNLERLFCDRLSVHIQRDPIDRQKGWGVDRAFVPPDSLQEWDAFKKKNKHVNLYHECLYRAKKELDSGSKIYMQIADV